MTSEAVRETERANDNEDRDAKTLATSMPDDVEEAARKLLEVASDKRVQIASAESCTGGLLASLLTDVEGYSGAFERGFVVYTPEAKCELLGIERQMVDDCGVVSRDVALALAKSALNRSNAGLTVGITGFAGPGGEDDEEGLVHIAVARRGGDVDHREMHFGELGRGGVRIATIRTAIEMMRAAL